MLLHLLTRPIKVAIALLLLSLTACTANPPSGIEQRPMPTRKVVRTVAADTDVKQIPAEGLSQDDEYWQRPTEEILQDLNTIALANLALAIADPMPLDSAQRLIAHPEAPQAMFAECESYWRDSGNEPEDERREWTVESLRNYAEYFLDLIEATRVYEIESGTYLLSMTCGFGPYWVPTVQFLYTEVNDEPRIQTLSLPMYDAASNQVIENPSNINYGFDVYDPETRILTQSHKYAGHGLCGRQARYRLEGDRFVLLEFRERSDCNPPNLPSGPMDFPQLYP
ncbi:MAG: DUF1176 domain-containing protein [Spirulinaceae cyanobacterium]